jgi:hypothetical protein
LDDAYLKNSWKVERKMALHLTRTTKKFTHSSKKSGTSRNFYLHVTHHKTLRNQSSFSNMSSIFTNKDKYLLIIFGHTAKLLCIGPSSSKNDSALAGTCSCFFL